MSRTHYKNVIEALGMHSDRPTILNKLNKAAAHTDDEKLRQLIAGVVNKFQATSFNPKATCLGDANSVDTSELKRHCEKHAYLSQ